MAGGAAEMLGTSTAGVVDSGPPAPFRQPADEADFNPIERGIIARARKAGFTCELITGHGPGGSSRRISGRRGDATGSGLIRFSLTRLRPDQAPESSLCYVQFRHWPARPSKVAELRAELDLIATEGRHTP